MIVGRVRISVGLIYKGCSVCRVCCVRRLSIAVCAGLFALCSTTKELIHDSPKTFGCQRLPLPEHEEKCLELLQYKYIDALALKLLPCGLLNLY